MQDSRLLLKSPNVLDAAVCARLVAAFAAEGVAGSRVELRGRTPQEAHLRTDQEIDIALDTFPIAAPPPRARARQWVCR